MPTGIDKMVEFTTWGANNMAYNIDFIPDEKWEWKPAPTAQSALELTNHVISSFYWAKGSITGEKPETKPVKSKEEAKKELKKAGAEFCEFLKGLSAKDLKKAIDLPWGSMPAEQIAGLSVIDVLHHRGQLCYIQTLLGDTQDHFEM